MGAIALVNRRVMLCWPTLGQLLGTVVRGNKKKHRTLDGHVINYFVVYDSNGLEAGNVLALAQYSRNDAPNNWVLLEKD